MSGWILWIIAACMLGTGEVVTGGFFLAPFATGAVLAALVAAIGAGLVGSSLVFIIASLVLLLFVRPVARRHIRQPPHTRTGTAALVGKTAMVLERIANDEGVGVARIGGEVWTARAYDDDRMIDAGEKVQVIEIRGATALVD